MPLLEYNAALLSKVSKKWPACEVAKLCDPPNAGYERLARILEQWFDELGGDADLRRELVSPDPTLFEGGYWHLVAAKSLRTLGFEVGFKTDLQGKKPDLHAVIDGQDSFVEVFRRGSTNDEVAEELRMQNLASELMNCIPVDEGVIVVSIEDELDFEPTTAQVDEIRAQLQNWFPSRKDDLLVHFDGTLDFQAVWSEYDRPSGIVVTEGGRSIYGKEALLNRVQEKLDKYGAIADRPLLLFVGCDRWTIDEDGLTAALFGDEEYFTRAEDRSKLYKRFNGEGILVPGYKYGHPDGHTISGAFFARHLQHDERTDTWNVDLTFQHSPYASRPIPNDTFAPIPERQVHDNVSDWVRNEPRVRLVLQ